MFAVNETSFDSSKKAFSLSESLSGEIRRKTIRKIKPIITTNTTPKSSNWVLSEICPHLNIAKTYLWLFCSVFYNNRKSYYLS